jgi:hypothetical protein
MERACVICGVDIREKRADAKVCGPNCRTELFYLRRYEARKAQRLGLPLSAVAE